MEARYSTAMTSIRMFAPNMVASKEATFQKTKEAQAAKLSTSFTGTTAKFQEPGPWSMLSERIEKGEKRQNLLERDVQRFKEETRQKLTELEELIEAKCTELDRKFTEWCAHLDDSLALETNQRKEADAKLESDVGLLREDQRRTASDLASLFIEVRAFQDEYRQTMAAMAERMQGIESELKFVKDTEATHYHETRGMIGSLSAEMQRQAEETARRFNLVEVAAALQAQKTDVLEGRSAALEGRSGALEGRAQAMEDRVGGFERKVEERFGTLAKELRAEMSTLEAATRQALSHAGDELGQYRAEAEGQRQRDRAVVARLRDAAAESDRALRDFAAQFEVSLKNQDVVRQYLENIVGYFQTHVDRFESDIASLGPYTDQVRSRLDKYNAEFARLSKNFVTLEKDLQPGVFRKIFMCAKPVVLDNEPLITTSSGAAGVAGAAGAAGSVDPDDPDLPPGLALSDRAALPDLPARPGLAAVQLPPHAEPAAERARFPSVNSIRGASPAGAGAGAGSMSAAPGAAQRQTAGPATAAPIRGRAGGAMSAEASQVSVGQGPEDKVYDEKSGWERILSTHPDDPSAPLAYYYNHKTGVSTYEVPPELEAYIRSRPKGAAAAGAGNKGTASPLSQPQPQSPSPAPGKERSGFSMFGGGKSPSPQPSRPSAAAGPSAAAAQGKGKGSPSPSDTRKPSSTPPQEVYDPATGWEMATAPHPEDPSHPLAYYYNRNTGVSTYAMPAEFKPFMLARLEQLRTLGVSPGAGGASRSPAAAPQQPLAAAASRGPTAAGPAPEQEASGLMPRRLSRQLSDTAKAGPSVAPSPAAKGPIQAAASTAAARSPSPLAGPSPKAAPSASPVAQGRSPSPLAGAAGPGPSSRSPPAAAAAAARPTVSVSQASFSPKGGGTPSPGSPPDIWAEAERATGWQVATAPHPDDPAASVTYFYSSRTKESTYEAPAALKEYFRGKGVRLSEALGMASSRASSRRSSRVGK